MTDKNVPAAYVRPGTGGPGRRAAEPDAGAAYGRLVEQAPYGVLVHRDLRPLYANPALLRLFGYGSLDELAALATLGDLLAGEDLHCLACADTDQSAGAPPPRCEVRGRHRDGHTLALTTTCTPIAWSDGPAVAVSFLDNPPQAHARAELERTREWLAGVLAIADEAIVSVDAQHRILVFNRGAERIFGYRAHEVLGRPLDLLLPPESRAVHRRHVEAFADAPESARTMESRNGITAIRRSGERFPAEASIARLTVDGAPVFTAILRDISERRRAEEALQRREREHRLLLEQATDAIFVTDTRGHFLSVNPRACELTGYSRETLLTMGITDVVPADDLARQPLRFEAMLRGETVSVERRLRRRDGHMATVEVNACRLDEGRFQAIVRDVTRRKAMEAALRRSEERYRNLVEGSIEGMLVHRDMNVLFANRSLATMLGYAEPDELVGRSLLDVVPPHERDRLRGYYLRRMRGEPAPGRYEFQCLRRNKDLIWAEAMVRRIDWEGQAAVQVTLIDITQRKRAEQERARLAEALEQAGDMVFITDTRGVIRYVNPAFERLTGYARREVTGRNPRLLCPDPAHLRHFKAMWRTVRAGRVWAGPLVNRCRDGSTFPVHAVHSPVRNDAGDINGFIAVHHDITEQQRLERHLRQAQRLEAVAHLAGGVAHEFNNQLQIIRGYCDLALRDAGSDASDALRGDLRQVLSAADKAGGMVEHLLTFTRRRRPEPRPLGLNEALRDLVGIIRPLMGETVRVRLDLSPGLPQVRVDAQMLEQIVLNLAANARDAMPEGGELVLRTEALPRDAFRPQAPSEGAPPAWVRLSVSDTGEGIAAEVVEHVFDPFFTTKAPGQGTGLGLSTAYAMAEQHGGSIEVGTAPGQGSTFRVYLPAADPLPDEPQQG